MALGWTCRRDTLFSPSQLRSKRQRLKNLTSLPCSSDRRGRINGGLFIFAGVRFGLGQT